MNSNWKYSVFTDSQMSDMWGKKVLPDKFDFKAVANIAASKVRSLYDSDKKQWRDGFDVFSAGESLITFSQRDGKIQWNEIVEGSAGYPDVQYIVAAIRNARNELLAG